MVELAKLCALTQLCAKGRKGTFFVFKGISNGLGVALS